jgi:outer membrane protein
VTYSSIKVSILLLVVLVAALRAATAGADVLSGGPARSILPDPAAPPQGDSRTTGPNQLPDSGGNSALPLPVGSRLSLKEAIEIALKYHPRVAEAAAETGAAREQIGEALSYLGPQVYNVTEYLRSTDNGIGNTSFYNPYGLLPRMSGRNHDLPSDQTQQSWDTSNNYAEGVGVSQYIFDFGRRREFVKERRFEAASTAEKEQLVKLDIIFEVSQRYFNVLRARQMVHVFEKAVEQRQFHVHEAQVKASAGLRPQLDIYVTQAEVERAKLHLNDAQNFAADAQVAFDNALGLGGLSPNYQLVDVLTYSKISDTTPSLLKTAFALRPDLKAVTDQARAMGAQVAEYRSDYFPTINAVGGYSAMGTGLPAANNFNAGIVITWPIFNSFLTSHQMAEAQLREKALQSEFDDLRQRIVLQVKTALLDWQASLQRIKRAEGALAASSAQLELSEKRYQAGLADIVELEDAQRNYTNDDAAYADALYGFSVAEAAVDQATGRGLR